MGGDLPFDAANRALLEDHLSKSVLLCLRWRLDVGARDTVVPAQSVLVKNAPEIAESARKGGEKRRQHAPAAQATIER
jgi:hypothetical protein